MKKIEAKIIADSLSPQGERITTMLCTFPRFILAEVNTHRMFSRNSASSRAIPFEKMVKMVQEDPFIPIAWQNDHKGMQGNEYITDPTDLELNINGWLRAKDNAVSMAKYLNHGVKEGRNNGVTKQICNRLLEPFMWHTALITATEWDNFFELRCPKYPNDGDGLKSKKDVKEYLAHDGDYSTVDSYTDLDWLRKSESGAEIHIQALAEAMWDARNESVPKQLEAGEWHIPFGDKLDWDDLCEFHSEKTGLDSFPDTEIEALQIKIAVARCARLSYMTFDGEIDYAKDIALHDQLLNSKHMSPFEHCAQVMNKNEYENMFQKTLPQKNHRNYFVDHHQGWCDNFRGFINYRYLIEKEYDTKR